MLLVRLIKTSAPNQCENSKYIKSLKTSVEKGWNQRRALKAAGFVIVKETTKIMINRKNTCPHTYNT